MKLSKLIPHFILILIFSGLVVLVSTPTFAQGTNITYWDMYNFIDDVDDYEGIRIVVFFLPTCPHCIAELPTLEQVDLNYNVTIFMLDAVYESSNDTLEDFKSDNSLSDNWLFGYSTVETNDFFEVTDVPRLVVLDDLGRVVDMILGQASYASIESKIADAINHNVGNYNFNFNEFTSISFWDYDLSLDDVRNHDGVRVVVFFLPDCSSCIDEIDTLKEIDTNYNVTLFLIDAEKELTNETLSDFRSNNSIPLTWQMGYSTNETNENFNILEVPKIIVLDEYGRIVRVFEGITDYVNLEESVLDAINLNTENYRTTSNGVSEDLIKALFIIIGVVVSVAVVYFVAKSFLTNKKG